MEKAMESVDNENEANNHQWRSRIRRSCNSKEELEKQKQAQIIRIRKTERNAKKMCDALKAKAPKTPSSSKESSPVQEKLTEKTVKKNDKASKKLNEKPARKSVEKPVKNKKSIDKTKSKPNEKENRPKDLNKRTSSTPPPVKKKVKVNSVNKRNVKGETALQVACIKVSNSDN